MATIGFQGGVPLIDFKELGEIPNIYRKARTDRMRADVLSGVQSEADIPAAAARLLQAGDTEGGIKLSELADKYRSRSLQQERYNQDIAFRRQEAERNQLNSDRSYNLQIKSAEEKPTYQTLDRPDGSKGLIKIDPYGKGVTDVTPAFGGNQASNPFYAGKVSEAEGKDGLYASRMINAESAFREPGVTKSGMSAEQIGKSKVPLIGNYIVNSDYQRYDQAKRDFINATLRRESGAAIADSEFANADKQYFPQPGDNPEVLEQKQRNRVEAIRGFASGAGRNWRPPDSINSIPGMSRSRTPAATSGPMGMTAPADAELPKIPMAAAKLLKSNPALRSQFDNKYGPGMAAKVLGE